MGNKSLAGFLAISLMIMVFSLGLANAATGGPNDGGTFVDDNTGSIGTVAWSSTTNAQTSDDNYATAALSGPNTDSHYLKSTGFGFSIPAGATITGITVSIEKSSNSSSIRDKVVSLVKGGSIIGDDKADTSTNWGASDTIITYGTSTDLWGQNWTASDINDANFGFVLSAHHIASGTHVAKIDHVTITVYYYNFGSGWKSPTINIGSFNNPTYAYADDTNISTATNGQVHQYYGYDFSSVPAGATIDGIEVRMDAQRSGVPHNGSLAVELSWDNGVSWTSTGYGTGALPNSETTYVEGGESDIWGHSWTLSELSNFRVRLTANTDNQIKLDWVPAIIYYTPASCTPTGNDSNCNGIDEDCSGTADDHYVPDSSCFLPGACAASDVASSCNGGVETACLTGTPAPTDNNCDGIDNNCNGFTDESYVSITSCFLPGVCALGDAGSSCVGGQETVCSTGSPTGDDANCNGIDEDCNGVADNGYVQTPTTCGIGACYSTGQETCVNGAEVDSCTPNPSSDEICNGIDDNCDGNIDDGSVCLPTAYYCDNDTDGYYSATPSGACDTFGCVPGVCTEIQGNDCDDTEPEINPDATEVCDGVNNDCNDQTPDGYDESWLNEQTSCGLGVCASTGMFVCSQGQKTDTCTVGTPTGDDSNCNGLDEDCSGTADDHYVPDTSCFLPGVCAAGNLASSCTGGQEAVCSVGTPTGDDTNCNGIDEDCDDVVDDGYVQTPTTCGIGACYSTGQMTCVNGAEVDSCTPIQSSDEICNGIDDNCDGTVDEGLNTTFYLDSDSDGFGYFSRFTVASISTMPLQVEDCTAPPGYVADHTDCNDSNSGVNPNATEVCDGVDNNCDGNVDEGLLFSMYYPDIDSDGYGKSNRGTFVTEITTFTGLYDVEACSAPEGYVNDSTDCDDNNSTINPGATEILGDGIDNNCNGQVDEGATTGGGGGGGGGGHYIPPPVITVTETPPAENPAMAFVGNIRPRQPTATPTEPTGGNLIPDTTVPEEVPPETPPVETPTENPGVGQAVGLFNNISANWWWLLLALLLLILLALAGWQRKRIAAAFNR